MRRLILGLVMLLSLCSACGQRGPLYLPGSPSPDATPSESAPDAAASDASADEEESS